MSWFKRSQPPAVNQQNPVPQPQTEMPQPKLDPQSLILWKYSEEQSLTPEERRQVTPLLNGIVHKIRHNEGITPVQDAAIRHYVGDMMYRGTIPEEQSKITPAEQKLVESLTEWMSKNPLAEEKPKAPAPPHAGPKEAAPEDAPIPVEPKEAQAQVYPRKAQPQADAKKPPVKPAGKTIEKPTAKPVEKPPEVNPLDRARQMDEMLVEEYVDGEKLNPSDQQRIREVLQSAVAKARKAHALTLAEDSALRHYTVIRVQSGHDKTDKDRELTKFLQTWSRDTPPVQKD
ncbi:MAG: hypothetical protein NTU61_04765 [Candidatus Altiarchaeota archaeon]|nr:hypothetical protein [Candidatus Altiarchaeota archaeon]